MRSGEVWKAKQNHPLRCKWDMIKILRPLEGDMWAIEYFISPDTPEEEIEILERMDKESINFGFGSAYCESELSREEILEQFIKIYS